MMGQFDSGQVVSLFLLIPGLWSVFVFVSEVNWSELMYSWMLFAMVTLDSDLSMPTTMMYVLMTSMLFWLMLLIFLV